MSTHERLPFFFPDSLPHPTQGEQGEGRARARGVSKHLCGAYLPTGPNHTIFFKINNQTSNKEISKQKLSSLNTSKQEGMMTGMFQSLFSTSLDFNLLTFPTTEMLSFN